MMTKCENWNCGIISQIRKLCEFAIDNYDSRLLHYNNNGENYITISFEENNDIGLCLWISWYKDEYKKANMWVLDNDKLPRRPTYSELKLVVNYYSNLLN